MNKGKHPFNKNKPFGNIYVADAGNNRIQKFNSSGTYVSQFGSTGSGNGQFSNPFAIAIDGLGNIYVCDNSNDRIQKFNSSGTYITNGVSQVQVTGSLVLQLE